MVKFIMNQFTKDSIESFESQKIQFTKDSKYIIHLLI